MYANRWVFWALLLAMAAMAAPSYEGVANQAGLAGAQGRVELRRAQAKAWSPGQVGDLLVPGDCVRTGPGAFAIVLLDDLTSLRLGQGSELKIVTLGDSSAAQLSAGRSWVNANPAGQKSTTFELHGPNAVAAVKGTSFEMEVKQGQARVRVWEGTVACRQSRERSEIPVSAGRAYADGQLLAAALGSPDPWQKWNLDCDVQLAREARGLQVASAAVPEPAGSVSIEGGGGGPASRRAHRPVTRPRKPLSKQFLQDLARRLGTPPAP